MIRAASFLHIALWLVAAWMAQILVRLSMSRLLFKNLTNDILANRVSAGALAGSLSACVGAVQAIGISMHY
jgi:uncharacterized membrane protein YjfL (UPF0719 family)